MAYVSRGNKEQDLSQEITERFGEQLTVDQLWTLVKMVRHCGVYCRNGKALDNFLGRVFPYATFRRVPKQDPRTGETYQGLQIRHSLTGQEATDTSMASEAA